VRWLDILPAVGRVLRLAERALTGLLNENEGGPDSVRALALRWRQGRLAPIERLDPMPLSDLIGVEDSIRRLRANARAFCAGEPALDVLLYGDRGTGKSTAVRGLLVELAAQGLRLVEVDRADLAAIPEIFAELSGRKGWYFVVCDDLSFDSDDVAYRTLKSTLDGGVEARPRNVRIVVTSNRRHLVVEHLSENLERGEIHPGESAEEKLSLSDRFGLALPFLAFDQETYLAIVEQHARALGLDTRLTRAELHARALRIALERGGRTGRTARQACIRIGHEVGFGERPTA
jgi:predicted AAA+ superfamily ATPase